SCSMSREKLNFWPRPAPGQHRLKYPSRSSPTSSGLENVKSSARCCSKNFRSPAAKASYTRCAKRRELIFAINLLSLVFPDACLDQLLEQGNGKRSVRREAKRALASMEIP